MMNVLVDTSIWSHALRRRQTGSDSITQALAALIEENRVKMIGPVRQELLSGIPDKRQFNRLKEKLSPFPDVPIKTEDYERAAEMFNTCRREGIQGSHIDFLICAVAVNHNFSILTADRDFGLYAGYLPIELFPRS